MTPAEIAAVHNMTHEVFAEDIPLAFARRAHAGTSHDPDLRGDQERSSYASLLYADCLALIDLCHGDDEKICGTLMNEFERYREGLRIRFLRSLGAKSRCISPMITGPSNFPVSRAQKASSAADKALQDLVEYRKRALKAIRRTLNTSGAPIKAGDDDAIERLEAAIADALLVHEQMKEANAAIRANKKEGPKAQIEALIGLGFSKSIAEEMLKPDCFGNVGFATYRLTNNSAEIRRLQLRLEQIRKAKNSPIERIDGTSGAYIEIDPPADRVRLVLPDKPPAEVRDLLKRNGFRWAPSAGAWSAYNRTHSIAVAKDIAGCTQQ